MILLGVVTCGCRYINVFTININKYIMCFIVRLFDINILIKTHFVMICSFITTFLQTLTGIEEIRCSVLMQCGNLFHLHYLMYFEYAVPGVAQIASFGSQPYPLPKFSSATQLWEEGFSVVPTCKARFVAIKNKHSSLKNQISVPSFLLGSTFLFHVF